MGEVNIQSQPLKDEGRSVSNIGHFVEFTAGAGANRLSITKSGLSIGDTAIVDNDGLNSLNNFPSDMITDIGDFETTSLTYVDVTGGTLDSFTLVRPTNVLFYLNIYGRNSSIIDGQTECTYSAAARLYNTTTSAAMAIIHFIGGFASHFDFGSPDSVTHSVTSIGSAKVIIMNLPAGTHSVKLQLKAIGGGTARISTGGADIGYTILGI